MAHYHKTVTISHPSQNLFIVEPFVVQGTGFCLFEKKILKSSFGGYLLFATRASIGHC